MLARYRGHSLCGRARAVQQWREASFLTTTFRAVLVPTSAFSRRNASFVKDGFPLPSSVYSV